MLNAANPGRGHGGVEHLSVLVAVNEAGASLLLQMVASGAVVVPQFKTHQASELSSASIELANDAAGALVLNVVSRVGEPAQFQLGLLLFRKCSAAAPHLILLVVHFKVIINKWRRQRIVGGGAVQAPSDLT
jgi:hypothetical protein